MITFESETIKCADAHSHLQLTGGETQAVRTHFWGVRGWSEILSTSGLWTVHCTCWLNDEAWPATAVGYNQLREYLAELREMRGIHGEVREEFGDEGSRNTGAVFTAATFEGFQPTQFPGQEHSASPIEDGPGMLGGGWILQGELRWTLLRDDEA